MCSNHGEFQAFWLCVHLLIIYYMFNEPFLTENSLSRLGWRHFSLLLFTAHHMKDIDRDISYEKPPLTNDLRCLEES